MQVSTFALGAMGFGGNANSDQGECREMVHYAIDAGVNFIDTADHYSGTESETILGEALKGRRDEVILATKFGLPLSERIEQRGGSRRWINKAIEASLRRLQTDWIDLYQLHAFDPLTDLDETLSALSDLIHQGKVRAIGASNLPAETIVESQWVSDRRNLERFRCEQLQYSLFARYSELAALPTCQRFGIGATVWSPLNGSWLTGKYRTKEELETLSVRAQRSPHRFHLEEPGNLEKFNRIERLGAVAEEAGISFLHMAMAFVVAHPGVTSAIMGPRTLDQLKDTLAGISVELSDDVLDAIDQIVPPGTTVNAKDNRINTRAVEEPTIRRRPVGSRAASS